jgi:hypothetical protein
MDGHDRNHRILASFLAGDLNPAAARQWDEHLLACEQCWRAVRQDRAGRQAVQLLRQPVPPTLADRVALAVEVAASAHVAAPRQARPPSRSRRRARPRGRLRWAWVAGAGALAAAVAVMLTVVLLPGGRETGSMPAAVAAVARYAQAVPSPGRHPDLGGRGTPVQVGRPVTVMVGGRRIVMRTWRLGGTEAVVATSGQPFPMPTGAEGVSGGGMAWSVRLGKLGLYCVNGRRPELVAAPVPAAELAALAARLPPA